MRMCECSLQTPSQKAGTKQTPGPLPTEPLSSSRQASWLFLCRPEELSAEEQAMVARIRQLHPELDLAYILVQEFVQMMRTRTGEQLDAWLSTFILLSRDNSRALSTMHSAFLA